jgi:hypothetical protein
MAKRFTVLLAVLLMVSVAFTATAQNKVLLQYAPTAGTTTKYSMTLSGNTTVAAYGKNQRTNLETAMTIEQKVTGVDRNGNIDLETTVLDGTITVNNTPTPLPNMGQIMNVKMAKDGEVLSSTGVDQQGNMNQMQIKFPQKPVGIGDSWTSKIEATPQMPIPMETKYTVVGFEKVSGLDCVKISSVVRSVQPSAGSINLSVSANGHIWFAHKVGYMVRNEVKSDMRMLMENDLGGGNKEKIETRMNLVLRMNLTK